MNGLHVEKGGTADDLEAVLAPARDETGLEDFGSADFFELLSNFVLQSNRLPFNDSGREGYRAQLHRWLVNRLRFTDDVKRHPEILDEDVSDPIIILGFPRSGTTMLQRMMSADPNMQSLLMWKVLNPAPFPGEDLANPVDRIAFAKSVELAVRAGNPDLFAAHPMIAEDAEEDWFLHHLSFQHVSNYILAPTYEYLTYLRSRPRLPTYEYVASLLRYLQWQDGGRRGRKWIMKSPVHIGNLDEVMAVHPKATLIYPKRDYRTVVASNCHVTEAFIHKATFTSYDPKDIGAITTDFYGDEIRRYREARRRWGSRLSVLEVPYQEILKDPIPHIRELYGRAGAELSTEGETAIRGWIANNPQGKHGNYEYSLERYGLTPELIDEKFGSVDDLFW